MGKGPLLSSLMWLLAGFCSSSAIEIMVLPPHWLLARNTLCSLPHASLHGAAHSMAACFIRASKEEEAEKGTSSRSLTVS